MVTHEDDMDKFSGMDGILFFPVGQTVGVDVKNQDLKIKTIICIHSSKSPDFNRIVQAIGRFRKYMKENIKVFIILREERKQYPKYKKY